MSTSFIAAYTRPISDMKSRPTIVSNCRLFVSSSQALPHSRSEKYASLNTGSPSPKYEHRRASALLHNIQNIRICKGKKSIVSLTYENERISIKNSLPYLKCVLRLSCVVHVRTDLWPFYEFLCKRFSLYINLYI